MTEDTRSAYCHCGRQFRYIYDIASRRVLPMPTNAVRTKLGLLPYWCDTCDTRQ